LRLSTRWSTTPGEFQGATRLREEVGRIKTSSVRARVEVDTAKVGWIRALRRAILTMENMCRLLANFVLMEYGTGAIMAVPGHDERDYDFCSSYGLPIRTVYCAGGNTPVRRNQRAFACQVGL